MREQVYFIRTVGAPRDMLKVGFSMCPARRLSQQRRRWPYEMVLLGSVPGTTKDECRVHSWLRDLRVEGEWFWFEGEAERLTAEILSGRLAIESLPYVGCEARRDIALKRWARIRAEAA